MIAIPEGRAQRTPLQLITSAIDESIEEQFALDSVEAQLDQDNVHAAFVAHALEAEYAHLRRRIGNVRRHSVRGQRTLRAAIDEMRWRAIRGETAA